MLRFRIFRILQPATLQFPRSHLHQIKVEMAIDGCIFRGFPRSLDIFSMNTVWTQYVVRNECFKRLHVDAPDALSLQGLIVGFLGIEAPCANQSWAVHHSPDASPVISVPCGCDIRYWAAELRISFFCMSSDVLRFASTKVFWVPNDNHRN